MKKGTYTASTQTDGSVMFRINGKAFTLRKGNDIDVEIAERDKVAYPASFMTLKLKDGGAVRSKSESKPEVAKKEIKKEEPKVEPKKAEVKVEKEEPKVAEKKPATRGRKKSVKIETEEK